MSSVGSHTAWRNPTVDGERWRIRHQPWDTLSPNLGELIPVRDTFELSGGVVSWPVGCVGRCLVAVGPMTKSSVLSVSLRSSAGLAVVVRDWADVSVDELQAADLGEDLIADEDRAGPAGVGD